MNITESSHRFRTLHARTTRRRHIAATRFILANYTTWPDFWYQASHHLLRCGYQRSTEMFYLRILRAFARFINKPPNWVTPDDINAYLRYLANQGTTRSWMGMNISVLRTLFDKLGKLNALTRQKGPRSHKPLPDYLNRSDIANLLASAPLVRDQLVIALLYGCGLKTGELRGLTWNDLDPEAGTLRLTSRYTGKTRIIRLPSAILPILLHGKKVCPGHQYVIPGGKADQAISTRSIQRIITQAAYAVNHNNRLSRINIPITPNTLRHSYAIHFLEDGGTIRALQETLDHQTLEATIRYESLCPSQTNVPAVSPIQIDPTWETVSTAVFPLTESPPAYFAGILKTHLRGKYLSVRQFFTS